MLACVGVSVCLPESWYQVLSNCRLGSQGWVAASHSKTEGVRVRELQKSQKDPAEICFVSLVSEVLVHGTIVPAFWPCSEAGKFIAKEGA